MMKKRLVIALLSALACSCWAASLVFAQEEVASSGGGLSLSRATLCETIEALEPHNTAVAFSIAVGKISCFTSFQSIPSETYALHKWFRRDTLVTAKRLTLKPPSWSTYSSIQLREADKGPWRVEIRNADNQLLQTLRFSVID